MNRLLHIQSRVEITTNQRKAVYHDSSNERGIQINIFLVSCVLIKTALQFKLSVCFDVEVKKKKNQHFLIEKQTTTTKKSFLAI